MTNEAFSRVKIDAQLRDQAWEITNTNAVRFEYILPDRTKADYVLCDRNGRSLAVVEAKKAAINPAEAEAQARAYAAQLNVAYIFLANGDEIRFWEWQTEAFPRPVKTFFSQGDLERRAANAQVKRDVFSVAIDKHIVERDYQTACIDALCHEIKAGRRKLLVEMATGTGKTQRWADDVGLHRLIVEGDDACVAQQPDNRAVSTAVKRMCHDRLADDRCANRRAGPAG